jgi:hypothetical protein
MVGLHRGAPVVLRVGGWRTDLGEASSPSNNASAIVSFLLVLGELAFHKGLSPPEETEGVVVVVVVPLPSFGGNGTVVVTGDE